VVLCGDFNAGPRSPAFRLLASKLQDVHARTKNYRPRSTFFSPMPFRRLDHIFVSAGVRSEPAIALRSPTAAVASDHLPVCADITLTSAAHAGVERPVDAPQPAAGPVLQPSSPSPTG
jgi:endonuclease/exonuclease/phosphatase family metal-dependent hydrolase